MGKTFGRVSPLSENLALYLGDHFDSEDGSPCLSVLFVEEDPPLDLKQGTPWTSDHGAGGGASSRCLKNLPK